MRVPPKHFGLLALAAGAIVLLVAVLFSPDVASGRSARVSAPPPCRTSQLVVWLDTMGNGVAGGAYYKLEFTNSGPSACSLYGYPGVSALSVYGGQLGAAAVREHVHPLNRITLASDRSVTARRTTAVALLRITDAGVYGRSQCRQRLAVGLRVYPPDQRVSKTVPFPFRACARTEPHVLTIQPVTAR